MSFKKFKHAFSKKNTAKGFKSFQKAVSKVQHTAAKSAKQFHKQVLKPVYRDVIKPTLKAQQKLLRAPLKMADASSQALVNASRGLSSPFSWIFIAGAAGIIGLVALKK